MFDVRAWLEEISGKVRECFGGRVVFIGFQGSYRWGEAMAASDVDLVVILDELRIEDLEGSLNDIIARPAEDDIRRAVKSSSEALYHAACHSFVFDNDVRGLYGKLIDWSGSGI